MEHAQRAEQRSRSSDLLCHMELMMKKTFELRDILTITTGRLLTKPQGERDNGIGALYLILEHLCGEPPFTHSLPRFSKEAEPYLLEWHPELANADTDALDAMSGQPNWIDDWLKRCVEDWGMQETYSLPQIPKQAHKSKNPIDELAGMMGHNKY